MTMRGFETVGVRAVIQGLPEYLAGAKAITSANVGISGSLKGLDSVTNGFKLLATAAAGVTAVIGGAAIASAVKYETTLTKISALTNTSAEDTAKLSAGLLQLARTVPKSPDELGAAAYYALSSGITDTTDALALVTAASKASAAGLGSTADIVDIVTAAINAYGKENLTAADATDILVAAVREGKGEPAEMATALGSLLPLAAALKIPFEDVAAVFASLTNALGGSGGAAQAATQFKGIMSQIISPSKEAKYALAEAAAGIKHLSQEEIDLADAHRAVVQASDAVEQAHRGVRDAADAVTQAQRGVRDAGYAVQAAQRDHAQATQNLRDAYKDLATAQRNQIQASIDSRRETLSVMEAQQSLTELQTQAGSHALDLAQAELAVTQAHEAEAAAGKKSATERRAAALASQQAELRLQQVRAQGGRYAIDLANAQLRVTEAVNKVGSAQAKQDQDVADKKKGVVKATQDEVDAGRAVVKAREGQVDAAKGLERSYEGVADAQKGVSRAQSDLALAMEKEVLAQIHTKDAYADLRKEIEEKGIVPALQHIQQLFADNQEGLAKLFPDIRGFIAFLSAISSQGDHTAEILEHVHNRLGLTDQAFAAVSKTAAFQASLFKNQVNVALIELGDLALPLVNDGFSKLAKYIPTISDFFKKGLQGSTLGGELSGIERAAFKAGQELKNIIQWVKDNKDEIKSVFSFAGETFLVDAKNTIEWFIKNKDAMAAAFLVIGGFFAVSNPAWAGILAGGAILLGVQLLQEDLGKLSAPLVQARIDVDKFLLRVLNAAEQTRSTLLSIGTLGISNLPGVKDLLEKRPISKAINNAQQNLKDDIADANSELAKRDRLLNAEKEIQTRIGVLQDEARQKGLSFDDALQVEVETMLRMGGATDGWARKLVDAAATVKGVDPSRIAYLRMELDQAEAAAKGATVNTQLLGQATAAVPPPDVGDAGKQALDDATQAAINELGAVLAVVPPDVGDAGKQALDDATQAAINELGAVLAVVPPNVEDAGLAALDAATAAGLSEAQATLSVKPPDVKDAGKGSIDLATGSARSFDSVLKGIRPPNVGDAGNAAIRTAWQTALSLASALGTAAANAQRVGTSLGSAAGGATRRAEGGIVRKPEIALMGEGGKPEVVLPLTDPRRSREILSALPAPLIKNLFPVQAFADGGFMVPLGSNTSWLASLWNPYAIPSYARKESFLDPIEGTQTGGGGGGELGELGGKLDPWQQALQQNGMTGGQFSPIGGYEPNMLPSPYTPPSGSGGGSSYFAQPTHAPIGGAKQVYGTLSPSMIRAMGGGAMRTPNAPISFDSLFGEINIGATSREVEELTVKTVRAVFAQARSSTAIGGGVISSGFG